MQLLGKRNRLFRGVTLAGALASAAAIYGAVSLNPFPGSGGTSVVVTAPGTVLSTEATDGVATGGSQLGSSSAATQQATSTPQPTPTTTTMSRSRTSRGS